MSICRCHHFFVACAGALVLLAGCSGDDDPDPAAYVASFEQAQAELESTVDALFESPAAQAVGAFADEEPPDDLDADQDAAVRTFMTEFWTGATDALDTHGEQLDDLAVPASLRAEHDAYRAAVDAAADTRSSRLEEIATSDGETLLASFWAGSPEIDAVEETCASLVDRAATTGHPISVAICLD